MQNDAGLAVCLHLEKMASVKSVTFGHHVNSDSFFANRVNPDETAPYEPFHQDFHCLLSSFIIYSNI